VTNAKHEALLVASPGYAAFVAYSLGVAGVEHEDLHDFADWHLVVAGDAGEYAGWDEDRWLEEWNHYHS
jgi:hypothetical protein